MAYTVYDFRTKASLKDAVRQYNAHILHKQRLGDGFEPSSTDQKPIRCYQPLNGPDLSDFTGTVALEGPHYPKPHTWYAQAELVNGIVVKVK